MSKVNVYGSFMQALFFSNTVSVPKYFLSHYSKLGLSNEEAMLIIHIFGEADTSKVLNPEDIAQRMNLELAHVERILANLTKQSFLDIERRWDSTDKVWYNGYNFVGLIDELAECWAIEQVKQFEEEQKQANQGQSYSDPSLEHLMRAFEQELARPLTEIECNFIRDWRATQFTEEMILEALKRGVSAGIRNFRYIDSILREWEKKGLRTRAEVEADDVYFQTRQESKGKTKAKTVRKIQPDKYENFYL
ncbi:DnaD domain-containing protein [Desulfitobacterium metallireducens]|uniref:DnaD-like protein n=1 Tax=Desulfitobacterium metallireducens DSM 15288 TaxID=871968 RepID=W0EBJ6_9FIRM|nr:DnaD domain protein [Desulfitobacterium metallireducens]AHF06908.1 DnaD-like protein [Desulfitobacterium metallireducens DSM 15288]